VQILAHEERRQVLVGPLAPLVADDPDLPAARDDVVEAGCESGGARLEVARRERDRDRLGGLEEDELWLHAELLEVPLLRAQEEDGGGRELEHAEPHFLPLGCAAAGRAEDGGGHHQRGERPRRPTDALGNRGVGAVEPDEPSADALTDLARSEERRVGEECRWRVARRWSE